MSSTADPSVAKLAGAAKWLWLLAGLIVGFAAWSAIGGCGLYFLRAAWPAYALAAPTKAYTLAMLLARLTVGVICTAAGGWVAATAARGQQSAAWSLGAVVFALSLPVHLFQVWNDYPAWYHAAYLVPLVPIAGLAGRWARTPQRA